MIDHKDVRPVAHAEPELSGDDARRAARRRLLTTLGAGAGVAATAALPAKWTKPLAESVLLPAHAQTSLILPEPPPPVPLGCTGVSLRMSWRSRHPDSPGEVIDGALVLREPSGVVVGPGGAIDEGGGVVATQTRGDIFRHTGDAPAGETGSESIVPLSGASLQPGTYDVGVGFGDSTITLEVTDCDGVTRFSNSFTNDYSNDLMHVLSIRLDDNNRLTLDTSVFGALF